MKVYRLVHRQAREAAAKLCHEAPDGIIVTFTEASKTREQEEKYHSKMDGCCDGNRGLEEVTATRLC